MRHAALRLRQAGLSLVEIMVAMVIGMIGILIITQAYITSDSFNRATLGEGGAQTSGLIGLFSMERDLRGAGYGIANLAALGCGNIRWYFSPNYSISASGTLPDVQLAPVRVIRAAGPGYTDPVEVTIIYGTDNERMLPTSLISFSDSPAEATVDGTAGFGPDDLTLLIGATGCTLTRVSAIESAQQKVKFEASGGPHNPGTWAFGTTYAKDDTIMNLGNPVVRTYSIVNNKLRVRDGLLQAGVETANDIADGIVDMRAQYGHDADGNGAVETWDSVTPTTADGWSKVLALRIAVLARIGHYEKPAGGAADCNATETAPTWSGSATLADRFNKLDFGTLSSEDRCYRYRVFETTVPLRNMIWRP